MPEAEEILTHSGADRESLADGCHGQYLAARFLGGLTFCDPTGGRSSSVCFTHAVRGTDTPAIISKFCQDGFI